ncbi:hypothetical protein DMO59_22945 [Salmonella enterica subsp. diarizonae]|nr:hypothetical protein [Salmonella enterica subsp. enterica serovar Oranienburg]ECJ4483813.1 hypothetical protein [Salmonella enterica subsp. diarizonae]
MLYTIYGEKMARNITAHWVYKYLCSKSSMHGFVNEYMIAVQKYEQQYQYPWILNNPFILYSIYNAVK